MMRFEESDRDWSDWHKGLSPERQRRYREVIDGIMDSLEEILKEHHEGQVINAMVPEGLFAVGVLGDKRSYAPFVLLTFGEIPTYEYFERISNTITNRLPISRVIVSLTHRVVSLPELGIQVLVEARHRTLR